MFKRSSTSSTDLEEYGPYTDYVNSLLFEDGGESSSGLVALNELATSLRNEWQVDTYDYKTMIRIKPRKNNLESLISLESRISKDLFSCTYNLGYLDIQIQGLGKYQSVKWLTQHLMKLNNGHDAMVQAIGKEEKKGEIKLLFMGDDDNDIEISTQATKAFIANPCSANMLAMLAEHKTMEQAETIGYASAEENLQKVIKCLQDST